MALLITYIIYTLYICVYVYIHVCPIFALLSSLPFSSRDEARCLKLLRFLLGRMAPGAALLIGEMLLPGEGEDPSVVGDGAALQDINMMVSVINKLSLEEREGMGS